MNNEDDPVKLPPSDEEIEKLIQSMVKGLKPFLANLTGENTPLSLSENDFQRMKNGLKLAYDFEQKREAIKNENISDDEKTKKYLRTTEDFIKILCGLESDNPFFEIALLIDPNNVYEKNIPDVNFRTKIRNAIHEILFAIDKMGKFQQITDFYNSVRNEDVFAMSQNATRIEKLVPSMLKVRKRITRKIIENYITFHKEISGFMESLLVIIYGLHEIMLNEYKSFTMIKKIPVGNLVKQLKSDQTFNVLVEKYDPNIRNAIAHSSYHVDPIDKKIEFTDKEKTFSLTYSQFVKYVQEITELAILLCHIEHEINYLKIVRYTKVRKNVFESSKS